MSKIVEVLDGLRVKLYEAQVIKFLYTLEEILCIVSKSGVRLKMLNWRIK